MLKKALSVMLVVVIMLTAAPLSGLVGLELPEWLDFSITSSATTYSGYCGTNVEWSYDTSTCTLTISGAGAMYNYYDYLYGKNNRPWKNYVDSIEKVVINQGVTTIGEEAFIVCDKLTSVTIPDSVTTIGPDAFCSCDSLTSITIPNSVTKISRRAFYGCDRLSNITIGDGVTSIGSDAFDETAYYNSRISISDVLYIGKYLIKAKSTISGTYTIKEGTKTIADEAFADCDSLTSITIPDSVISIGNEAFAYCDNLTSIIIPDSVTTIGKWAFADCDSLTSITIPDSVATIDEHAFYSCGGLTEVNISDIATWCNISFNDSYANPLYDANTLKLNGEVVTDLVIPDGVTEIKAYAFVECTSLTSVTIGDSVISIGNSAFSACDSLTSITVNIDNQYYSSDEYGVLFNKEKTELIHYPKDNTTTSYEIPNGVTIIDSYEFSDCDNLTSITIPDSVTTIGDCAFYYCDSLTSVTIGNSVTTIGRNTFDGCTSLASIAIPDGVTTIGDSAFRDCDSLTSVTIGNSVTTIGYDAFYGCDSLTSITVDINNQHYSSDEYGVLFNKDKTTLINYPIANTRTSYTIPDSVTTIGNRAFYYCTSLTSVTIPDSVTAIGNFAFRDCDSLTSVTIGNSVTTIGRNTFDGCTSLASIAIPDGVTSIAEYTFYSCTSLTNVTIPNSVTTIGEEAFCRCTSLTSVTIGDSVTTIGDDAFSYCTSLTSVTIGNSVTTIGDDAFRDCTSLTEVNVKDLSAWCKISFDYHLSNPLFYAEIFKLNGETVTDLIIPKGVTKIKPYAFYSCTSLTSVTIPDSVTTIGYDAFYGCDSLTSVTISNSVTKIDASAFYDCDNLTDVYYSGTEEEWNTISIGSYNYPIFNTTIHFNHHIHDHETEVTAPTCTTQGYTTYTCECGDSYIDNYVEPCHKPKTITIPAKCTVAGMSYNVCKVCGETVGTSTVIPATGHTAGDWETVLEPTYEADGKMVKKCTVCGEIVEEEVIPMLVRVTVTDENTGISMEFDDNDYNGEVEIVVEETFDSTALDVIDTNLDASQSFIYDITMTVDGVVTQPNGTVKVKIPLPSGYDPNRSFVYHVNTETGTVEKMPATYENGYMVFETTHFSYYAVVEEYNYTFSIQTPSRTEFRHKDGIKLHANVEGTAPAGSFVEWSADNSKFKTEEINNGNSLKIISDKNGTTTFTATLYSAKGEVLATDSIEMKSKAGFFDKIGSFFRSLFGATKIYEY